MKCPKCDYLGFETGDRCRNCGYDFSLVAAADAPADLPLNPAEPPASSRSSDTWMHDLDAMLERGRQPDGSVRLDPMTPPSPLPLFGPAGDDDEPLIKLPPAPRPPLAVRRPVRNRATAQEVDRPARSLPEEPSLQFTEPVEPIPARAVERAAHDRRSAPAAMSYEISSSGRRLGAAAIDHAILLGIDSLVIYFTLKMAALTLADWRFVPLVPFVAFLALVKLGYFLAFTAVGGQTIGKMAAGIRVISDDNRMIDIACAARRTLGGALSLLTLGVGFIPALVGADRRALHDRLAGTRVVALPSH